jgi:hypothetical protein
MIIERAELEQVARSIGERWGRNLRASHEAKGQRLGTWPCGLDDARRLIDELLGTRLSEEEREPLAIIAERSARRAWGTESSRSATWAFELPADVGQLRAG